jgi:hypothetical protein
MGRRHRQPRARLWSAGPLAVDIELELESGERLVMSTAQAPFPMETT